MAATNSNRLSATLTDAQITALRNAISTMENTLPWLTGLTRHERMAMPKMSEVNKTFTEDALNGLPANAGLFPAYVKADEISKDFKLYGQLDEFVQRVARLNEMLTDTQTIAGHEAFMSALTVYRLTESAAKAGLPGADTFYRQLKQRFAGQGPKAAAKAPKGQ